MPKSPSLRIGKVTLYQRGNVWYLRYHERGCRRQVRAGPDRTAARQLASNVNAQLEAGIPAATSFEPIDIAELQKRWLEHHEQVRRSSMATINRYRTATNHLLAFCAKVHAVRHAGSFQASHGEAFVRYLMGWSRRRTALGRTMASASPIGRLARHLIVPRWRALATPT